MTRRPLLALLAAALAGCSGGEAPPRSSAPASAASARAAAPPPSPPSPARRGWLDAPDNDPDVVKLGREALACDWNPHCCDAVGCAAYKAWHAAKERFEDGKADPTLVNMLEDADERVRLLAARHLSRWGKAFRADRALAERVVAAAERERAEGTDLGADLGMAVAMIDVDGTGVFARVEALVKAHPLPILRSYLVSALPTHNPTSAGVRRLVEGAIHDPNGEVRMSAARAYLFVDAGAAESCAFWSANITHGDARVVGECAYGLSEDRCQRYHERLLTTLERSDVALTPFSAFASALSNLCKGSAATGQHRSRATKVARTLVERGADVLGCIPDPGRSEGLDAVVACDPRGAKAYVGRFLSDPNTSVREHAAELWKGL